MNKYLLSLALAYSANIAAAMAQDTSVCQIKNNVTIGFESATEMQMARQPYQEFYNRLQDSKELFAHKRLTKHFDVQAGIAYTVVPMGISVGEQNVVKKLKNQPYQLSLPLSLQYNFLSEKSKLRPYIGAGGIYDIIKTSYPVKTTVYTDGNVPSTQNGNKSIGVYITQGVIYEVNTKIEFNANIHFIQEHQCKTVGFGVGLGYKL
jgi:outer membrane protein W